MASIQVREIMMGPRGGPKKKVKRYIVRWEDQNGIPDSKTFDKRGRYDVPDTAEYFKSKIEAKLRDGEYVNPDLGKQNVKVYAEKWRDRARKDGTYKARQQFINNLGPLAKLSLAQVQRSDIRDWTDLLLTGRPWCKGKVLQLSTVSLYLQHLTTLLQIAVDDELIVKNAARKFRLDGDDYEEGLKGPTATELLTPQLISRIREHASETVSIMILLSALTGLRVSEVAGLRVQDVNFVRRELNVVQQAARSPKKEPITPKTKSSRRTIPLSKSAVETLAAYLADDAHNRGPGELIFAAPRGGRWYATLLGGNFRRACDKAGLGTEWSWHDLRHYFASRLIFKGRDVKTVSELLGHSSPNMTWKVYVHLWPGQEDALREDMDEALQDITAQRWDENGMASDLRAEAA
ncbi:tyrosine-type recombinase/integrase [Nocardia sp. IBHARD005]|uniref:tyrosine-type recombinase/integrase n=1 Tax=Nocardia sp. IBHARD005 TaxID=3457765 RepID=UPI0040587294